MYMPKSQDYTTRRWQMERPTTVLYGWLRIWKATPQTKWDAVWYNTNLRTNLKHNKMIFITSAVNREGDVWRSRVHTHSDESIGACCIIFKMRTGIVQTGIPIGWAPYSPRHCQLLWHGRPSCDGHTSSRVRWAAKRDFKRVHCLFVWLCHALCNCFYVQNTHTSLTATVGLLHWTETHY